jgi:hypothetical protein
MNNFATLEQRLQEMDDDFEFYYTKAEKLWRMRVNGLIPTTWLKYQFPFFFTEMCPKCGNKVKKRALQKERTIYDYRCCSKCDYEVAFKSHDGTEPFPRNRTEHNLHY